MTTLNASTHFSNACQGDFVSTDSAALASHMDDCATSRGRFFGMRSAFESAHSMVIPRLITATAICLILAAAFSIV